MRWFFILLFILLVTVVVVECNTENPPFVGRVVYMEYIPEHMCHDEFTTTYRAYVHVHTHVPHRHQKEKEQYLVYVANKDALRRFSVDKDLYNSMNPGDKVSMTRQ
jgi:hypothetical protein